MKNKIIAILLLIFVSLLFFNIKTFATEENLEDNIEEEQTSEQENIEDTADTTEQSENNNVTYKPQSASGSSYVTSVSAISSQYQANLGLNNVLSILLIAIGILLILFSIAILIRIKK